MFENLARSCSARLLLSSSTVTGDSSIGPAINNEASVRREGKGGICPRGVLGFTLVEVLVALVIIAILTTIAIPMYTGYVSKSRQRVMWGVLMTLAQTEEMYKFKSGTYTNAVADLAALGYANTAYTDRTNLYAIAVVQATATSFYAQATGNLDGDATNDVWRINETGALTAVTNDLTN